MRVLIYTIAVPALAAFAFAQDTPPAQPKQPTENATSSAAGKSGAPAADHSQEVKTQTYAGTLMDASCAKGGSPSNAPAATPSADRSAAPAAAQGCTISSNTTQFALQMKDGNTVQFDDVGNARVQEALKTHKSWNNAIAASKPIRVKATGLLNSDKLIVVAVN
jgi:hypothetical protein